MREVEEEYASLVRKSDLSNKYAVDALKEVAKTNDQFAKDIIRAIKGEMKETSNENKEALLSLLKLLAEEPSYYFIRESPKRKRQPEEASSENSKKRKVSKEEPILSDTSKGLSFFPYPLEYFLLKMISKSSYKESYLYYTKEPSTNASTPNIYTEEPKLTREYLIVPRLQQAIRLLYTADIQCKVCGLRFDSLSLYSAHGDMHQKKSQIGRSVEIPMWRSWLLEPVEWSQKEQKVSITIKSSVQEQVSTVPVRGDREQKCTICGDGFDVIWSDENECWSFNDAIITRAVPRQISHRRCIS